MALYDWQLIKYVSPAYPFGNGTDGNYSSATVPTMTYMSCSGTSTQSTITLSSGAFTNGDILKIIQMRGTGVGQWEIVRVVSGGGSTTLTISKPLVYTYTDSGASQAQVVKIPQYNNVTISSGTWSPTAWDGNVGGILTFACNKIFTPTGSIVASGLDSAAAGGTSSAAGGLGLGSRGGTATNTSSYRGEGTSGDNSTQSRNAAGTAGGGADSSGDGGGGGGGHATAGSNGTDTSYGYGGDTAGDTTLNNMIMGGSGGGGRAGATGTNERSGGGGGGAIVSIYAATMTAPTSIISNGGNSANTSHDGGGGAGGSILIVGGNINIGSDKLSVSAGTGNTYGGAGGKGRIAVYYNQSLSGSISSSLYGSLTTAQDLRLKYPIRRGMFI